MSVAEGVLFPGILKLSLTENGVQASETNGQTTTKGPLSLPDVQSQKSKAHYQNVIPGTKY